MGAGRVENDSSQVCGALVYLSLPGGPGTAAQQGANQVIDDMAVACVIERIGHVVDKAAHDGDSRRRPPAGRVEQLCVQPGTGRPPGRES